MRTVEEKLHQQFVVPVIRLKDPQQAERVVEALFQGGFATQEMTLMSPSLIPLISKLKDRLGLTLGAGTVLDREQATAALVAGADFLVSPGFSAEVSDAARVAGRLYIPGVMTPTEVTTAYNLGHRLMKLFPATALGGLVYLKNLQAPFPDVRWMLTGGIKTTEVADYRQPGVDCVGLGQELFPKELLERGAWDEIAARARSCLAIAGVP